MCDKTRYRKLSYIFLLIFVCACALTACSLPQYNKQAEQGYVVWRSVENSSGIVMELLALPFGHAPYGFIEYDGEAIDIIMNWSDTRFSVDPVDYYGKTLTVENGGDGRYSLGSYNIIRDDKLELKFSQDGIFGGELTGETIVLIAYEIDPADYEIGLHHEVCWESASGELTLYTYQQMRRFSVGQYSDGTSGINIVVYWLDNKTFSAYELSGGAQGAEELLSGQYDYDGQTLRLSYAVNALDRSSDSELTARGVKYWEQPQEMWYPADDGHYAPDAN